MPHKLFDSILLYDDQEVSAASPWSWHEAPTRLLDYPGAGQHQDLFDFCGLPSTLPITVVGSRQPYRIPGETFHMTRVTKSDVLN